MRRLLLILLIIAPILGYAAGMGPGPGVKSYSAGDVTPPEKTSLTIPSAGTTLLLGLSETCSIGAGGNGGLTLSMSGGAVTASYSSGSGSNTFTYNLSRTVNSGETGTASYTQPGNGIEDTAGNDLASFSSQAITNNSEQSSGEDDLVLAGDTTDRSGGSDYIQSDSNALVYNYSGYNGTSGTLRYGYLRTGGELTASNIKMVVYTRTGTTWSLLETSTPRSFVENSLIEFTFSGTNQIPSGTGNVIIGWIADGYCNVKTSGSSWQMVNNTSGTYASPPGTIAPDDDPDSADALMEIFVTNYQR
jgi:hypothetical protein